MKTKKDAAALKRLWLTGKYLTLEAMCKGLKAKGTPVSLTTLKRLSTTNNWRLDRTKVEPAIERKAISKMIETEGARLAKIKTSFVTLQEVLLARTLEAFEGKKGKLDPHQALRAVQGLVQINARIFPAGHDEDDLPPPASVQVAVQVNNHQAPPPDLADAEIQALEDEDLEAAIRAGRELLEAERSSAPAKKPTQRHTKKGGKRSG